MSDSNFDGYVTLHASVLARAIHDIVECARELNWSQEDVFRAIAGLYRTAERNGGTLHSVDELATLLQHNKQAH